MSITAVIMPRWGLTMEEGTLTGWSLPLGGGVASGQEIAEVETSKLTGVVEATVTGVLRRQIADVGATLPVGALLGVIADDSVDEAAIDSFVASFVPPETGADDDGKLGPQTIEIGGVSWSYLRTGEGGPPFLLLHGFGGDANGWGFVQAALAAKRETIAVDLPGHGSSGKTVGDGSLEGQAASVASFLTALGIEKAHLVGHSMGGGIALALALQAPERVASLTLVAPMGLGDGITAEYLRSFAAARKRREVEGALRHLFADEALVTAALAEEVLKYKRIDGVPAALDALVGALLDGGVQRRLYRDRLAGITVPVTVIWGERDGIIPAAQAEGLPSSIRVERLPDVGHMPQVEAADRTRALIEETAANT